MTGVQTCALPICSKNETISNNGEVKLKIEQVRIQTRQKQIKRKPMDEKTKKRLKDKLSVTNVLNNA